MYAEPVPLNAENSPLNIRGYTDIFAVAGRPAYVDHVLERKPTQRTTLQHRPDYTRSVSCANFKQPRQTETESCCTKSISEVCREKLIPIGKTAVSIVYWLLIDDIIV